MTTDSTATPSLKLKFVGPVKVPIPQYQTSGAAGVDLHAALEQPVDIQPGQHKAIPTGLSMALPVGYEGQVRPRSGLAAKAGITVLNAPGTIDEDYRGEVKVLLINHSDVPVWIKPLDRIAQLVVAPVSQVTFEVVEDLDSTERGTGGFGSTGQG